MWYPLLLPWTGTSVVQQLHVITGSWFSAGYHMGTTIAVPAAILPLPYAFSQLSWGPAIIALLLGTCTTYYSSWLLAGLFNWNGQTYYRYRDLVKSIYGKLSISDSHC